MRVLGVRLPDATENESTEEEVPEEDWDLALPLALPPDPQAIYEDAKEEVAAGIEELIRVLKSTGHPVLDQVAQFGLLGLTDGQHVALTKALLQYRSAPPAGREQASKQVQDAVAMYRKTLRGNVFSLMDDNPFGVEIGFRSVLDPALADIAQAVG